MKRQKMNAGFTLIELLVVIAIIGLLSSVVLASLNNARAKGRDARRISDLKQIQTALELYANDNKGSYPPLGSGPSTGCTRVDCVAKLSMLVTGKYIPALPSDPLHKDTNTDNLYRPGDTAGYTLLAYSEGMGANGAAGWCRFVDPPGYLGWNGFPMCK